MRVLFAHDHHFIPIEDKVYSESQFDSSLWSRYLANFDEVTVFSRKGSLPAGKSTDALELSSANSVDFVLAPSLSSIKGQVLGRRQAQKMLRTQLKGCDAVIARLPSELGLLAVQEAKNFGIPCAIEMVGCPLDGLRNYGSYKAKLYAPLMASRVRSAVAGADYVLYVTNEFLQSRYPNHAGRTVGCSDVEIPTPSEAVLKSRLDKIDKANSNPFVLGLIGTLKTRYKGIQTIFEALAREGSNLPPIEFRILGAGDQTPWKEEAARFGIEDKVRFDGTLSSGAPVLEWVDGIDLYLQPSLKEGLPRALIEAMSRGCPALASTCAGIPELLDDQCLIPPGDAAALAELLKKTVNNYPWLKIQAERNWSESKNYAKDVLKAKRADFIEEFTNSARRKGGK